MNDAPRQALRALVARHGTGLCSDARRCEALLRDHAGAHRREVNTLVGALKERVPLDLLAAQSAMPRGLLVARLAKRLEDHLALTPEAARWAVDSWALALGVVTGAEVAERERAEREERERKEAPPSTTAAPPPSHEEDAARQQRNQAPQTRTTPATRPAPQTQPARPAPPPPRQQQQRQSAPPPSRATTHAPQPQPPPSVARTPVAQSSSTRRAATAGALPSPAPQPQPRDVARGGRRWTLRGCAVGCLLLVILSLALLVGGPFVLSVLREEQQRRNLEPSPVLSP